MKKPGDWLAFDAGTTDAKARELAAAKLDAPEERIEVERTGGAVLARVRQGDGHDS